MPYFIGIDCATRPQKTGVALGVLHDDRVIIERCTTGDRHHGALELILDWVSSDDEVILGLDAPLGWPEAMGQQLAHHQAGMGLTTEPHAMFRRYTDSAIKQRLGKQPLDVGSNLIARTAHMALTLLQHLRAATGLPIPLAWAAQEGARWRAIEVYPAATRLVHGVTDKGGHLTGLEAVLDWSRVADTVMASEDAADATVCALAAADFYRGRAVPPGNEALARREGWIWTGSLPPV
jgi:predicted RNase H-like nuclease